MTEVRVVAGAEEEPFERTTDAEESRTPGVVVHGCIGHGTKASNLGPCEYGHWTVTHVASGRRFPWFFRDKADAHGFATSLGDFGVDWTDEMRDRGGGLPDALKLAIRQRVVLHRGTVT